MKVQGFPAPKRIEAKEVMRRLVYAGLTLALPLLVGETTQADDGLRRYRPGARLSKVYTGGQGRAPAPPSQQVQASIPPDDRVKWPPAYPMATKAAQSAPAQVLGSMSHMGDADSIEIYNPT